MRITGRDAEVPQSTAEKSPKPLRTISDRLLSIRVFGFGRFAVLGWDRPGLVREPSHNALAGCPTESFEKSIKEIPAEDAPNTDLEHFYSLES